MMTEVIYRTLMKKKLEECFGDDLKSKEDFFELRRKMVLEIKDKHKEELLQNVDFVKETTVLGNGKKIPRYNLRFNRWEGSKKCVCVPDKWTIEDIVENIEFFIDKLILDEMYDSKDQLFPGEPKC